LLQRPRLSSDEHAAFDLVRFDRLEMRSEIAFAKTLVALAPAWSWIPNVADF
jgi:hypothetical protein